MTAHDIDRLALVVGALGVAICAGAALWEVLHG